MARIPVSTYRLQVRAEFDLDAAAAVTEYLHDLGVDTAYLSPILQSAAGSAHGYDVVDPTRVDAARGGPEALDRFSAAARTAGLGVIVDIVPNHQGVEVPAENPWWWDVLARGTGSPHAVSFDIDWAFGDGKIVLPVLGDELDAVIAAGDITLTPAEGAPVPAEGSPVSAEGSDGEQEISPAPDVSDPTPPSPGRSPALGTTDAGTARYYDLVVPLAAGTAPLEETNDPDTVRAVLGLQHWKLAFWKHREAIDYRRFFTVSSLAGIRVELPEVWRETHAEILRWLETGLADGLRIDHPDGLADPGAYLDRLAEATGGAYVVVEKILERGERLPEWWKTHGTTGYDTLATIDRVLTDPAGEAALTALDTRLRGHPLDWEALIETTKREVAETSQSAEIARLVRLVPTGMREAFGEDAVREGLVELAAAFPVYRAYLPAGIEHLDRAEAEAAARHPVRTVVISRLAALIAEGGELSRRFMQTTGPVMAKGVEDCAFYRYTRLGSLTEVGADPSQFAITTAEFHDEAARRSASWPHTMTTLTTHDTKRSEDVRARLAVLAEMPDAWAESLEQLRAVASTGDGPLDNLLWQTAVGAWPLTPERFGAYAEKVAREGGIGTNWSDPHPEFEARVQALVDASFGAAGEIVGEFARRLVAPGRSNALAAKVLQLAGPGVPDLYQGTELWDLSLVDPDNRRPVDYAVRRELLQRLDEGWMPEIDDTGAAKLLVVSRTLRLRRERPELFTRYEPVTVAGEAGVHAVAFDRGGAIALATRLPVALAARGGWADTVALVPPGTWQDAFTGRVFTGGELALAEVLRTYPVALLVPADA